jgi:hypothetical protein
MSVTARTGIADSVPATTVTVSTVLFGDASPQQALAAASGWPGVRDRLGQALAGIPAAQREVVIRELGGAVASLLGLRVGDVLVAAWRAHRSLLAAGRATLQNPAATEMVQLGSHRITTAHRPYVDVVIDDRKIATLHFDLSLVLDVDTLLATVRRGRLVALASGRCAVTASLGCEGVDLVSRTTVVDPAASVTLRDGVPLTAGTS